MPNSNWLSYASVKRGLILAAFLIPVSIVSLADPPSNPVTEPQKAKTEQTEQKPEPKPATVAPIGEEKTPKKAPEDGDAGKKAEYYKKADLDAQVRMAQASEELVEIADRQFTATIVEIILLILAVFAALWAAWSATKAANAAQAVVEVTTETAKRQLRAYFAISKCTFREMPDVSGIILSATLTNSGATPAFNVRLEGEAFEADYPLSTEKPHPIPKSEHSTIVGAGANILCTRLVFVKGLEATMNRIKTRQAGLWIQGTAFYDDCFGKPHFLRFRHVFCGTQAGDNVMVLQPDRDGNEAD